MSDPRITVSTEQALEVLRIADIVRLEADGNYTRFIMKDGRPIISSRILKHYDNMLEGQHFLRVHNSHIINLIYVRRLVKADGGSIELSNGDHVPLSRRRKEVFLNTYLK
jgi:two-component system LytT family response regulator